jgi:hypothetical protein
MSVSVVQFNLDSRRNRRGAAPSSFKYKYDLLGDLFAWEHSHGQNTGPLSLCAGRWCLKGSLPNPLGCSLGPLPFASAIKCHQKSTSNSAGSPVGSLAPHTPPPGHPAAGRCGRVVPVPPLLICTRPAPCASSAFDWGSTPRLTRFAC